MSHAQTLCVEQPELSRDSDGRWRAAARVHGGTLDTTLWFVSDHPLSAQSEAFVAAVLLPAMAAGLTIQSAAPVSDTFLTNLESLQEILTAWHPHLRRITVDAPVAGPRIPGPECVAFFSGGVDSFTTVCRHHDRITRLVLVRGFDIPLTETPIWSLTVERLQQAAADLQRPLVLVETNVREALDRAGDWGIVTHGAGLASIGHVLGAQAGTVLVPSTHHLRDLFPWGTHPLLDALWSSDAVRFTHDGAHLTRVEKTASIARNPIALRYLRVCWKNDGGAYNCGSCEKCLRTMIALDLAGALEDCRTFPGRLDAPRLGSVWVDSENAASFARENLERARELGRDELVDALGYALWRFGARQSASGVADAMRRMPLRLLVRRLSRRQKI